jgi:2'-5' RNA ligase
MNLATLYTLSYPEIPVEAAAYLEAFRREHDIPYRDVVAAHFTMVFGCNGLAVSQYTEHVATVARASSPISFSCRYAMLGADDEDDTAYVFLVPDEGYSAISMLHDQLYTGILEPYLRLDIPYVPHITIGTMKERRAAKVLCDELNARAMRLDGQLVQLTIGALQDGKIQDLSSHRLST